MTTMPNDQVRLGRAIVFDLGEDQLRHDILGRIDALAFSVLAGVRLDVIAADLRRAADLAETDPVGHFRAWLARVEADARRALEQAA